MTEHALAGEGADAGVLSFAGKGLTPGERDDITGLPVALAKFSLSAPVLVVASSSSQAERMKEILRDGDLIAPVIPIEEAASYGGRLAITVGQLSAGLCLPGAVLVTEREAFGGRPAYRPIKRSHVSKLLLSLDDLVAGDYVVHRDHGIGLFHGLSRQFIEGTELDLLAIDYASGGRLYLPLHAIETITKYHGEEATVPRLDALGAKSWQRRKEKVRKKVAELAGKLLKIYAEREVMDAVPFSADTEMHMEFDSFFPYEETPDQITAIEEIKRDMEDHKPMDRLLAGDVGYGKTEVAMRAAFKAAFDGRQVAVLVPTTLLCEQHYRIFAQRFAAFPIKVDYLSRFKTPAARKKTLAAMRTGEVDVIIATHTLLGKSVGFSHLGLLIIDEEHRFGVAQKEKIKSLTSGVDVLSLSATPIPRTLQMSLSGIRKMSVIETPPEERLAVRSTVSVYDPELVRDAVRREVARGGQVFFVHNRIHDIERVAARVRKLVPEARIAVAHGRMAERQLESIMLRFLNMEVDVLVSTAIVGSGLDIPTANTIVIDMAHRMGLADLYQLKGRVGRGNVKAYAYFLTPPAREVKDDARKRLQAIQELSYMGAGLRLAMKDLEIRGAGNMLGPEQSGNIDAVGFEMYVEMLKEAVARARGEEPESMERATVDLHVDACIPEGYVQDMTLRLSAYRAVAGARDLDALRARGEEMADRFGRPPKEFQNLLSVMSIRLMAEALGVVRLSQSGRSVRFIFSEDAGFQADRILQMLGRKVRFFVDGFQAEVGPEPLGGVRSMLEQLARAAGGG